MVMDRIKQCLLTLLNRIIHFIHKVWYEKWLVLGCLLLFIPLGFYIYTFASNGISDDTEKWAQFGDYIGGTYSVLLSVLVIYIARKLTKKDEKANKEKNAVDLIFQQILKIERCVDFHQKANAVNKLMRMIDTHQLHISDEIRTCIENLGNYYLTRINGSIDEDLVYENSVKNKLKKAYYGL